MKKHKTVFGSLVAAIMMFPSAGQAAEWQIVNDESSLNFTGYQTGNAFQGQFGHFGGFIDFDPAAPEEAQIAITVEMASADAGSPDRNSALPGADWFNSGIFPQAEFTSEAVSQTGAGQYQADGMLTIKGHAVPLVLPFTLEISGDTAHAQGGVTLNRTDFSVGEGQWESDRWIGHEVDVRFDIKAIKAE